MAVLAMRHVQSTAPCGAGGCHRFPCPLRGEPMAGPAAKAVTPNALMRCRSTPLRLGSSGCDHPLRQPLRASGIWRARMLHRDVTVDEKLPGFGLCGNCNLGKLE